MRGRCIFTIDSITAITILSAFASVGTYPVVSRPLIILRAAATTTTGTAARTTSTDAAGCAATAAGTAATAAGQTNVIVRIPMY